MMNIAGKQHQRAGVVGGGICVATGPALTVYLAGRPAPAARVSRNVNWNATAAGHVHTVIGGNCW